MGRVIHSKLKYNSDLIHDCVRLPSVSRSRITIINIMQRIRISLHSGQLPCHLYSFNLSLFLVQFCLTPKKNCNINKCLEICNITSYDYAQFTFSRVLHKVKLQKGIFVFLSNNFFTFFNQVIPSKPSLLEGRSRILNDIHQVLLSQFYLLAKCFTKNLLSKWDESKCQSFRAEFNLGEVNVVIKKT
jgi:hypothetical protein